MSELKNKASSLAFSIAEKCAGAALVVTGTTICATDAGAALPSSPPAAPAVQPQNAASPASLEGAILLDIVTRDPETGDMVAGHYSHASHGSHASHASHYSSRY